jgi:hypothetical protein
MNLLRLAAVALALAVHIACQEPFGTDRHELVGDRVLGLVCERVDDNVTVRPLLLEDGHLWTEQPPSLAWAWVDEGATLEDALDEPFSAEPAARFPTDDADRTLALRVVHSSGEVDDTTLSVPADGPVPLPTIAGLTLAVHEGWTLTSPTEEQLALDARLDLNPTPAATLPFNGWARLTAVIDPSAEALTRVRWMTVGARGTFLELDPTRTDWAAGDLLLDDLEIEEANPIAPGIVTVVMLALDDRSGNRARITERWVGEARTDGLFVSGRWLHATESPPTGSLVRATLIANDGAPTGLRLEGVEAVTIEALPDEDPYGTEALPCTEPVAGPFDPIWLVDGRCSRAQVADRQVVLQVDP